MAEIFGSYLNIIVPAVVSIVVGVTSHYVSFKIAKSKNDTSLDVIGFQSLENQLGNVLDENRELEKKLEAKDEKAEELRDLKYNLELKIAMLEKEMQELKETVRVLNEENFQLKSKLSMMKES
jgi:peptidoglycan hydrolase CwlO-like protein